MMCGKNYPDSKTETKPVVEKTSITEKESEVESMKSPSGKKGTCLNCLRDNLMIADKKGLCSSCHRAVDGISEGAQEYVNILAAAKERYGKKTTSARSVINVLSAAETQAKIDALKIEADKQKPAKPKSDILQMLKDRRHALLTEAEVITQTIIIIEKYSKAA